MAATSYKAQLILQDSKGPFEKGSMDYLRNSSNNPPSAESSSPITWTILGKHVW